MSSADTHLVLHTSMVFGVLTRVWMLLNANSNVMRITIMNTSMWRTFHLYVFCLTTPRAAAAAAVCLFDLCLSPVTTFTSVSPVQTTTTAPSFGVALYYLHMLPVRDVFRCSMKCHSQNSRNMTPHGRVLYEEPMNSTSCTY